MNESSLGCIEVNRLQVVATHGVLPEERIRSQAFELDLRLWIKEPRDGRRDDIRDTVDYARVITRAQEVMTGKRSYYLLETLADAVLEAVFELDDRILSVEILMRKMNPPVAAKVGSVALRYHRSRRWHDLRRQDAQRS